MFLSRRQFLKSSAGTVATVTVVDKVLREAAEQYEPSEANQAGRPQGFTRRCEAENDSCIHPTKL
jgi:hypothetical protein